MFDVSNVSFIHMISQIYRHTYPFLANMYIYIPWSLSHRPTMSHNKHEPKGPRPQNEKTERREGEKKKKKILSAISDSDFLSDTRRISDVSEPCRNKKMIFFYSILFGHVRTGMPPVSVWDTCRIPIQWHFCRI